MSNDITFMRGYGFPRGSGMDYAGYGGLLVNNPRRFAAQPIPYVPEPSVFQKIPALDGFGDESSFGTEYTFRPEPMGYGDMTLPTLDVETGEWVQEAPKAGKALGWLALAAGLYFAFGR